MTTQIDQATVSDFNPYLGLKDEVIKKNLRLVHKIAHRFHQAANRLNISYEDIFSEGCIGLIKAFYKFDPSKFEGSVAKFSTYAVPMIIGEIQRFLRDKGEIFKTPRKIIFIANKARNLRLEGMDVNSIAEKLKCNIDDVEEAMRYLEAAKVMALEQEIDAGKASTTILDTIGTEHDFTAIHVDEFLNTLPQKHRQILELRMEGYSQAEIANRVGISQAHVSRILLDIKDQVEESFANSKGGQLK